ncbi:MAG: SEL1-like repeat protein [Opitutales bacterium]|nr:SEL1-like repeat protein [Opitutales bacterium]
MAAKQGKSEAQYYLGFCYVYGDGIKENKVEAVKWWRKEMNLQ